MTKFAHIVNPVKVKESSDLFVAQPITFETMRVAQKFAHEHGIDVKLYSAQFPEDHSVIPNYFFKTPDLERSILDILNSSNLVVKRKLPLIKEILDRLHEFAKAEYLIYTNVDIALMPNFYVSVSKFIEQGYDAFTINRRTISNSYRDIKDIPMMYAEIGKKHGGRDCFVFNENLYKDFFWTDVCLGMTGSGTALFTNLICNATQFGEFNDSHLTFHLGDDKTWRNIEMEAYSLHNSREVRKILEYYQSIEKLPNHYLILNTIERHRKRLDGIKPKVNLNKKMRRKLRIFFQKIADSF